MIFIELPLFQKLLSFSDEELWKMQNAILENPETGDVMVKGHGVRKMRVALPGRGKRGGARVIYYWWASASICYLIYAYPKNIMDAPSDKQLKMLADMIRKETENG